MQAERRFLARVRVACTLGVAARGRSLERRVRREQCDGQRGRRNRHELARRCRKRTNSQGAPERELGKRVLWPGE